jgi:hypothetical protein
MGDTQQLVVVPLDDGAETTPQTSQPTQNTPVNDDKPKYKFMKLDTTLGIVELVIAGMCGLFVIIWLIIGIQMLLSDIDIYGLFSYLVNRKGSDYSSMVVSDFLIYKIAYIYSIIYTIAIPGLGIAHFFLRGRYRYTGIFDTTNKDGIQRFLRISLILFLYGFIFFCITTIPIIHIFGIKIQSSKLGNIDLEEYETFNNYYNSYAKGKIKSKKERYNAKIKKNQNRINDYKREIENINNFKYTNHKNDIKMQKYLFDKVKKKNQPK